MTHKAFLLEASDCGTQQALAVYSDRVTAEAEAERLKAAFTLTKPAFDAWCSKRWVIVEDMRRHGIISPEKNPPTALPNDAQEAEIVSQIGPCPALEGHESCQVYTLRTCTHESW